MRDIVSHHILDKERGKVDAHDRKQEEKQIVGAFLKTRSEQYLYLVHDTMQEKSGNGGKQTDDKSQDKRHLAVGDMLLLPRYHFGYCARFFCHFIYHLLLFF